MAEIRLFSNFIFALSILCAQGLSGQQNKFVQLHLSGGVTTAMPSFRFQPMFAGLGPQFEGSFEYFFSKWGIGVDVGTMFHPTQKLFSQFVEDRYNAKPQQTFTNDWRTTYGSLGPVFKISRNRFELDLSLGGGIGKIKTPKMVYIKSFGDSNLEMFSFQGYDNSQWLMSWNGGVKMIYRFNNHIAWHIKGDYISVLSDDKARYSTSFVDLQDRNKNGSFETQDYFESDKYTYKDKLNMQAVNIGMGLTFQLARAVKEEPTPMFTFDVERSTQQEITEPKVEHAAIINVPAEIVIKKTEIIKPVEKITIPETEKLVVENQIKEDTISKPYIAPESTYDAQAATFLYKAGESYFAANDFESALPCFNKLKADPTYPHAKYMFAMTLSSMGNCDEAATEYKDFTGKYKGNDIRTFDILFKSQLERCKQILIPDHEQIVASNMAEGISYKIQFIATSKSDATFPKLAEINEVGKEFLSNRKIFRYNLETYFDLDQAQKDMYKVRKMGFPDAFIAMYQDGERVNTLHHAK